MEAGKELDALVAEKLMGWEAGEVLGHPAWHHGSLEWTDDLPHYSTDILAAWQVVRKMTEPFNLARDDESEWWARFGYSNAYAKSAPLVICLAALKTVENERD